MPLPPGDITRRAVLGVLAAGAAGFIAFGPRGRQNIPAGRLVLDYWEKWTGHEGKAMERIVDRFNTSQDRLFVRYLVTGTIHQKALIAIAGGDPPDIVGLNAYNVPTYAQAGAVMALDELAPAAGLTLEQYAPGMRQVMTHTVGGVGGNSSTGKSNSWWAAINTSGTLALYWNRAIFRDNAKALEARGLDPTRAPATIEEFELASEALNLTNADGTLARAGHLHLEPGWWSWIWGYYFGGPLYDAASDRSLASSPETVAAYEWVQRTTAGKVEQIERLRAGFGPYGTARCAFLTGEVAMVAQGPWMANLIREFTPDLDYGVAPVPVAKAVHDPTQPIALIDTDVLMIPRGCRHPEASMEFIAFTQRQENVEELATAHCKGSPMASVSEAFLANHPNRGVRLHTSMASSPRAFISPATPSWVEMKDIFDTAMARMWKHEAVAKEELATVQKRSQAILDRAAGMRKLRATSNERRVKAGGVDGLGGAVNGGTS